MANHPSLETRIDKAAEEILMACERNGIDMCRASNDGSFAIMTDIANLLHARVDNLAKIRCLEAAAASLAQSKPSSGSTASAQRTPGSFQ